MHKRILAMVMAAAFCVTLGLAVDPDTPPLAPMIETPPVADPELDGAPAPDTTTMPASTPEAAGQDTAPPAETPAGQSAADAAKAADQQQTDEKKTDEKQAADTKTGSKTGEKDKEDEKPSSISVGFTGIERTVLQNNLTIQSNDETLQGIESMDLDSALQGLNFSQGTMWSLSQSFQDAIDAFNSLPPDQPENAAMLQALTTMQAYVAMNASSYDSQKDSMKDSMADLEDNAAAAKVQFKGVASQLASGAQTLFLSITTLELQQADLQRNLAALDRSLAEMQKRYELGQISEIQLLQLKNQRMQLASSVETLKYQIKGLRGDLGILLGYDPDTTIKLSPLPAPTASRRNYDADLKEAIQNSYTLAAKNNDLRTAGNSYKRDDNASVHTYNGVKIAYEAAEQQLLQSFRKIYDAVDEKERLYKIAQQDEEYKQRLYTTAVTKYRLGLISKNEYLTVREDYEAAQSATQRAKVDVFTAQNQYNWAKRGLIAS